MEVRNICSITWPVKSLKEKRKQYRNVYAYEEVFQKTLNFPEFVKDMDSNI